VTLPVILDNLQEEILQIARDRDINDNDAHNALMSAVDQARARAAEFYNSSNVCIKPQNFDDDFREVLTQQIAALAKTKLTKLENLTYALCAAGASGIAFIFLKLLLLERKEYLELRSYYSRNYPYYSYSYNSYNEDEYFNAVASFALGGGVAGLSSLMWFKDALLGNQDYLAHDRLVLLKVALFN
ncbi:MAG: hypothetical protein ACHQIM_23015, partial [Sphingobacteriales bacterium]